MELNAVCSLILDAIALEVCGGALWGEDMTNISAPVSSKRAAVRCQRRRASFRSTHQSFRAAADRLCTVVHLKAAWTTATTMLRARSRFPRIRRIVLELPIKQIAQWPLGEF